VILNCLAFKVEELITNYCKILLIYLMKIEFLSLKAVLITFLVASESFALIFCLATIYCNLGEFWTKLLFSLIFWLILASNP